MTIVEDSGEILFLVPEITLLMDTGPRLDASYWEAKAYGSALVRWIATSPVRPMRCLVATWCPSRAGGPECQPKAEIGSGRRVGA